MTPWVILYLFVKARFILQQLADLLLPQWYFAKAAPLDVNAATTYELPAFSGASNEAYACIIHLRRISNETVSTSFVFGNSHIVLENLQNWPIARKELIAAVMSVKFLHGASNGLQLPDCS